MLYRSLDEVPKSVLIAGLARMRATSRPASDSPESLQNRVLTLLSRGPMSYSDVAVALGRERSLRARKTVNTLLQQLAKKGSVQRRDTRPVTWEINPATGASPNRRAP